eukprot:c10397_g1_i1 orf=149-2539(+)
MPSIRWSRFSGKNRGDGGRGGKCEKAEGKDAVKCQEGQGMKKRGILHRPCVTSPVVDALIEFKSKPNPEVGVTTMIDSRVHARSPAVDMDSHIKSKRNSDTKSLQEEGSCGMGVYAECKERDECIAEMKQGIWHSECTENETHDAGSQKSARVTLAELCAWSMEIENRADSSYKGWDAACMDTQKAVVYDKAGHIDCVKAVVYDNTGDADCMKAVVYENAGDSVCVRNTDGEALTQAKINTGLNSNSMEDVQCKAGIEKEDDSFEKNVDVVPHDFICGISKKVMEDPVVVASGQTFERVCIQAWLDDGNTLCPITHKPLSHLQLIPNLTLKALISSWLSSHLHGMCRETAHHSFSSCLNSLSSCPSPMIPNHQSFISCSDFSNSKLLGDTELCGFSSSSSSSSLSSLPKLLQGTELYSFTSSSRSVSSNDTLEHLRPGCIHNFPSPSSTASLSHGDQEGEVCSLQEKEVLDASQLVQGKQGEDEAVMSEKLQSRPHDTYIASRIKSLVSDLESIYIDIQRNATAELRLLAKHADGNRVMIANAGALRPLVALLLSKDESIQLDATTTLLNLSLNNTLKERISKEGAIEALVQVLRGGLSAGAKENAAIALACLAVGEANKSKIGLTGAVPALVDLLDRGTPRGKKDAATALYRLSSIDENKRRIVRAGATRLLVDFMSNEGKEDVMEDKGIGKDGMADKAIAILGNLVSVEEGRVAFVEEGGIMCLMQVIQEGSKRSKRLAVPILSQLCTHSSKHRSLVLQKEPLPTLMALSQTGDSRLKAQVAEVIQVLIVDAYA